MAKIELSQGFKALEPGFYKFKIFDVEFDDIKNKITVELVTEGGETHREIFSLLKNDGSKNDGALWAFSDFVRKATRDNNLTEIDTDTLKGKYIQGIIEHNSVNNKTYAKLTQRGECVDFNEPQVNLDDLLG